jgi:hypothetical protein
MAVVPVQPVFGIAVRVHDVRTLKMISLENIFGGQGDIFDNGVVTNPLRIS